MNMQSIKRQIPLIEGGQVRVHYEQRREIGQGLRGKNVPIGLKINP